MSRKIRIDPAKEELVDKFNAKYEAPPKSPAEPNTDSIDQCLEKALDGLRCLVVNLRASIIAGNTDRETVQGLKDVITLLMALRDHEKELLENLPDDELRKLAE